MTKFGSPDAMPASYQYESTRWVGLETRPHPVLASDEDLTEGVMIDLQGKRLSYDNRKLVRNHFFARQCETGCFWLCLRSHFFIP